MPVIRHADSRRTETPIAVMTTFASPRQGGAGIAVWRVDMPAGRSGPPHAFDTEQVWTVLSGAATVELDGETTEVGPGDTVVMPAGAPRRVHTGPCDLTAVVAAPAGGRAYATQGVLDVPPGCAVPDGDKLVPAWTV
ncbi:cupin domain-containing protein [Sphaerisporangium aureirubrum]|uniref:Cupin domain-containing protein n=1 Tax=Sphaerisporangium aureirubrum TaxID=1544736 RepID=A0ABW1NDZ3_9ACTN